MADSFGVMSPIAEFDRLAPGVVVWRGYHPDVRTECGSTAVRGEAGWVVFDPLPLEKAAWAELLAEAPVAAVLLTNGNHERDSIALAARERVRIHAPAEARGEVAAEEFHGPGALVHGFRAIPLPGAGPGETAWSNGSTLVLGDALIHLDGLALLPDKYCSDARRLRKAVKVLGDERFERMTFAHGEPLTVSARARLADFLSGL